MKSLTRLSAALLAGASLALFAPAMAQDPAPAPAPEAGSGSEEVTVTATRRATNIQKTPVAITAVGAKLIENAGIKSAQDLQIVVPALQFPQSESAASVAARIRGIGTQGSNPGLESAVGIFIDGVFRSRNAVGFGDLGEVERIEVLRGPQGTLFGRNTSAGLISVISKKPSFETGANASLTYESFDGWRAQGSLTGALSDTVAMRIFAAYQVRDGWVDVNPGTPLATDGNDKKMWTVRGQVLWNLSDNTSIRFIADYSDRNEECCVAATIRGGGPGSRVNGLGSPGPGLAPSSQQVINAILGFTGKASVNTIEDQIAFANRRTDNFIKDWGLSAELETNFSWGTLTSVTGYRDWKWTFGQDADFSAADLLFTTTDGRSQQHFKTFTQEFRLNGTAGSLDWLVGAFYMNEELDRNANTSLGTAFTPWWFNTRFSAAVPSVLAPLTSNAFGLFGGGAVLRAGTLAYNPLVDPYAFNSGNFDTYQQDATSFAIFTHNVWSVTEAFKVTVGVRYTTESKDFSAVYRTVGAAGCAFVEDQFGFNPGSQPALGGLYCFSPGLRRILDQLTATTPHTQTFDDSAWSGVFTLSYDFSEAFNAYATYSRGYKSGGFNLDRSTTPESTNPGLSIVQGPVGAQTFLQPDTDFAAEEVDSFEIGGKLTLDDGRLFINTALFYQSFENFQLNTFGGISFFVTAVPKVISKGVELDVTYRSDFGLTVQGGVAYTDAHYDRDALGSIAIPGSFVALNPGLHLLPGSQLTSSPKWTISGAATYEFGLSEMVKGVFHLDGRYVSSYVGGSNLDPNKTQEGFALFNARLAITSEDERYALEFFARNIFDKRYFQIAFDSPLQGSAPNAAQTNSPPLLAGAAPTYFSQIDAFMGEPRTMGVSFKVRY